MSKMIDRMEDPITTDGRKYHYNRDDIDHLHFVLHGTMTEMVCISADGPG